MTVPDERLPRVVVVTARHNGEGWEIDIDAPDLDPWQTLAYLEAAVGLWEDTQLSGSDD